MLLLETSPTSTMQKLADVIRELMAKRNLQGVDLATAIGISPNALSAILTGKSMPRVQTFLKMRDVLAKTPEEVATLSTAFSGQEYVQKVPMAGLVNEPADIELPKAIIDRSEAYLDSKALSIEFHNDIERLLLDARIPFLRSFIFENGSRKIACDFVTKSSKNRIVIEAKANLNRDWDHTLGTCLMVRQKLPAQAVIVVVPYHNEVSLEAKADFEHHKISVVRIDELIAMLRQLGA